MTDAPSILVKFPPAAHRDFIEGFWSLAGKHLPLRGGRDTIHVSPEDAQYLPTDAVLASRIDPNLRHLEMRLEVRR